MTEDQPSPATPDPALLEASRKLSMAKLHMGWTCVRAAYTSDKINAVEQQILVRVFAAEALIDRLAEMFSEATGAPLTEVLQSLTQHLDTCAQSVAGQARRVQVAPAGAIRKS